jgi:hypothetical protein
VTHAAVGAIDILMRGVGQVMFQNNPITGLLFLVGIFINSYECGLTALLGVVVATFAAYLLGADRTLIEKTIALSRHRAVRRKDMRQRVHSRGRCRWLAGPTEN